MVMKLSDKKANELIHDIIKISKEFELKLGKLRAKLLLSLQEEDDGLEKGIKRDSNKSKWH